VKANTLSRHFQLLVAAGYCWLLAATAGGCLML